MYSRVIVLVSYSYHQYVKLYRWQRVPQVLRKVGLVNPNSISEVSIASKQEVRRKRCTQLRKSAYDTHDQMKGKTRSSNSSPYQVIPRAFARTRHASSRPLEPGGICKGSVDTLGNKGDVHRIRTANGARVYPDVAKLSEPIAQDWLGHVGCIFVEGPV